MMPRLIEEIERNEDDFTVDGRISSLEIKANFTWYTKSMSRFRVSAEQLFSLLYLRNDKLEEINDDDEEESKD